MKLWEEIDKIGVTLELEGDKIGNKEIRNRGLFIRQSAADVLFFGLTGESSERVNMFSIEPSYITRASFDVLEEFIIRDINCYLNDNIIKVPRIRLIAE